MTGVICGTGSSVPVHTMDNNDIAQLVETSDEWIQERTGVVRRHIITEETTVSMAADAARKALENSGTAPEKVDLILVSTISSNVILPCAACEVQKEIGAVNATCYDMSAACTGFVLGYSSALAYLASGMYSTILVIGSESLSNLTNWKDRGTCILFGDGAGAAVVKAGEGTFYYPVTHSEGAKGEALTCTSRYNRNWESIPEEEIFLATKAFPTDPKKVRASLERSLKNLRRERIDLLQLHGSYLGPEVGREIFREGGILQELKKLRDEGLVRYLGFSIECQNEVMHELIACGEFDVMQIEYNFLFQVALPGLL